MPTPRRRPIVSRCMVTFRLTVFEREELLRLATFQGLSTSDLLRGWIASATSAPDSPLQGSEAPLQAARDRPAGGSPSPEASGRTRAEEESERALLLAAS